MLNNGRLKDNIKMQFAEAMQKYPRGIDKLNLY
jgi:hypothetical protein